MKQIDYSKTVTTVETTRYQITKNVRMQYRITDGDPDTIDIAFYLDRKSEKLHNTFGGFVTVVFLKDKDSFKRIIKERVTFHDFDKKLNTDFNENVILHDYTLKGKAMFDEFIARCENEVLADDDFAIEYSYDHTWRDVYGNRLEQCVHIDEINGFTQNNEYHLYDWEPLCEHLKNHPRIINFKREKVPGYNASFYGQEGLSFDVIIEPNWEGLDAPFHSWVHTYDHLGTHKFKKS